MPDALGDWERTHDCCALRAEHVGAEARLMGWVNRRRDHGGVIFVDLRDRWGLTQVVFDPRVDAALFAAAERLRNEFVIAVGGKVRRRPPGQENPKLPTGDVEVIAAELKTLSASDTLPIYVNEEGDEDERVRLRYRYLDLRRERMQRNLAFRSRAAKAVRDFMDSEGFLEIDTPVLAKSTPEGARDFLVPSRLLKGAFYALPQSPQLFKQVLMASGFERYYQIVKCYRDEDLRADRQPEHTQIDLEMSFAREEHVFTLVERLIRELFAKTLGVEARTPFPRMSFAEAALKYGTDKPDGRYGLEVMDVTEALTGSEFKVFENVIRLGGRIRGFRVPGGAALSRKDIDDLITFAQKAGAAGLAWMKVKEDSLESSIVKYFSEPHQKALRTVMSAAPGDLLAFIAGQEKSLTPVAGDLRMYLAEKLGLQPRERFSFLWVTDFPLFEWDAEAKGWAPMHHVFTMPREEDIAILDSDPSRVRGRQYDLVLNGVEIGSGSVRIHLPELQKKVFGVIGMTEEYASDQFGFLLEAFRYGAPPHCGIALGFDRLLMLMLDEPSIREVIPFPKTQTGADLMTGAPSPVRPEQLVEVGIRLIERKKDADAPEKNTQGFMR
ncbi:MAG: aspartate--tRNA ligase [bacterium]